jgi:hypothetical protein
MREERESRGQCAPEDVQNAAHDLATVLDLHPSMYEKTTHASFQIQGQRAYEVTMREERESRGQRAPEDV